MEHYHFFSLYVKYHLQIRLLENAICPFARGESGFWKARQSMFPGAVTYSVSTLAYLIQLFEISLCQASSSSVISKAKLIHASEPTVFCLY